MTTSFIVRLFEESLRAKGLLLASYGAVPSTVTGVTDDSRAVTPGGAFVAVRGHKLDGHTFLEDARARGASLAIVEDPQSTTLPRWAVPDARLAAAVVGAAMYNWPSRSLDVIGVTGTSGKTTTVAMVRHLLDTPGAPSASIGTLGALVGSDGIPLPGGHGLTTPGPFETQRLLHELHRVGVRSVAMEVSSHALDQRRVDGVEFAAAVFTNLSRDHLDYHVTMEAYGMAKARLIGLLRSDGVAAVNADERAWDKLPSAPRVLHFGLEAPRADVRATDVVCGPTGSSWTLTAATASVPVRLPLIGDFNVGNALGAAAVACGLGHRVANIAERLGSLPQVPGRLERVWDDPVVLRDYAHKPDALERALDAVRPFTRKRLIVLVGCGGDRDKGKRPIMGEIAERKADLVVLTSDNPRTEDPERILDEMEQGMRRPHVRIEDRRAAIAHAFHAAHEGDVVVLAGKGHETYQIRGTTSYPFDEKAIVTELASEGRRGG